MKLYRVAAVFDRHLLETRRSLERITDLFYWPLIDVITWGFFSAYLAFSGNLGRPRAEFLVVAAIVWSLFRGMQRDIAVGLLSEIWARNLTMLLATPLTLGEYIAGVTLLGVGKAVISTLFAISLAKLVYVSTSVPRLLMIVPLSLDLFVFGFAVGIFITGLIIRYSTRVQSIAWSVTGILLPVSCVFYPMSALPTALRPVAWLLPTAQVFEGIRQIVAGGFFPWRQAITGWILALAFAVLAVATFRLLVRRARDLGLLVKPE